MTKKDYELIQKVIVNLASNKNYSWMNHSDKNVRVQVVCLISSLMYNLSFVFKEDNPRFSEIIFEGKIKDAIDELITNFENPQKVK